MNRIFYSITETNGQPTLNLFDNKECVEVCNDINNRYLRDAPSVVGILEYEGNATFPGLKTKEEYIQSLKEEAEEQRPGIFDRYIRYLENPEDERNKI